MRAEKHNPGPRAVAFFAPVLGILMLPLPLAAAPAEGPLRVHPDNPRYFTDGTQSADGVARVVYLTGSHTWPNLIDRGLKDPPPAFDFKWYLDFLEKHDHNFIRLWSRHVTWYHDYGDERVLHAGPLPWERTGPGNALDGKPRFDLTRFDKDYFDRLRSRVTAARDRGIYVSVMLFGGNYECTGGWRGNPFNAGNNINDINGDPNNDGQGRETHTLSLPAVTRVHKAYVRKVIDTVNDLDNVLYEISNESHVSSKEWQYHLIRFIHRYEADKPKQHPVGMTALWGDEADIEKDNRALYESEAEWVSPLVNGPEGLRRRPPEDGRKVSVLDSDHWFVFDILKDPKFARDWVWQAFCNGHNPILMEQLPLDSGGDVPVTTEHPAHVASRRAMGFTRRLAGRMNLARMTPRPKLASTGYCLASPGEAYLVYQPKAGEKFSVDLKAAAYRFEWLDPSQGAAAAGGSLNAAGGRRDFHAPLDGAALLYLARDVAEPRRPQGD